MLNVACEACQKSIESSKGKMVVKEAARAVSERDDRLLAEKMEALEAANREVSVCACSCSRIANVPIVALQMARGAYAITAFDRASDVHHLFIAVNVGASLHDIVL